MSSNVIQFLEFLVKVLALDTLRDASFFDITVDSRTLVFARLCMADTLVLLLDELRMYEIADPIFLLMKARSTGIEVATIVMALSAADQITDFVASSSYISVKRPLLILIVTYTRCLV